MSPNVATVCPKCGFQHPAPTEVCAKCGIIFARFSPDKARVATASAPAPGFQHATAVLTFKEKGFALNRKNLLQGLDEESASHLAHLGMAGWELVSAVPFSSGGASLSFTGSAAKTDAVLAFFKRALDVEMVQKINQIQPGKVYYSEGWWRVDGSTRYGPYATREEAEKPAPRPERLLPPPCPPAPSPTPPKPSEHSIPRGRTTSVGRAGCG